ncbi:MAG: glycerophosphodiester phosphodiesterase [Anaerolineae bacterium]|nr:glycerophosphodiester phosphodiesterase [Anaerolineae bacterium]
MHIIAHRGASAYEPENTLRAFERALELGADWVELDLRLTADGQAVVLHPEDLGETTDGRGPVSEKTLAEVRRFHAGLGERVPTLIEVLDSFGARCGLYVELKAPGTPRALAEALARVRPPVGLVAASFQATLVRQAATLLPSIPASILSSDPAVDLTVLAKRIGARMVHLCWEDASSRPDTLVTPDLLSRFARHGLEVVLWHEERPEVLEAMLSLPVWGVCTNTPDAARALLKKAKAGR